MLSRLDERAAEVVRGKVCLVTGGAGTVGAAVARRLLRYGPRAVRLVDNDEGRLFYLGLDLRADGRVRCLLGDVRDRARMARAMNGVDLAVHAAALKHVELGEYNPFEVVHTNLTALQALLEVALDADVERLVFTSSDKAVNPTNVMGGSKFIGERLVVAANGYRGPSRATFCCTRFGNVLGSAGSVVPVFARQIAAGGPVTVTDPDMTRFFMTLDEAVDLVVAALTATRGGEIFVPKMHAVRLLDLAELMVDLAAPPRPVPIAHVGLRAGEKFYEELVADHEVGRCLETARLLIVLPDARLDIFDPADAPAPPGPADYPDAPGWAGRPLSSRDVTPLDRPAVRRLLQAARACLPADGGRPW